VRLPDCFMQVKYISIFWLKMCFDTHKIT
jgi:hypothetical protein